MDTALPRALIDDLSVSRVVGTVLELAAQGGLDSVSDVAIAERMGVPPSAIARCVPGTDAIWDAVKKRLAVASGSDLAILPVPDADSD